jgi:hypothetical protein
MCVAQGWSLSLHYTKGREPCGGGKQRTISRDQGLTIYKFETCDCDAEDRYLDKLKQLR